MFSSTAKTCCSILLFATLALAATESIGKREYGFFDPYGIDARLSPRNRQRLSELTRPWPDVMDTIFAGLDKPAVDRSDSLWTQRERRVYTELLKKHEFDILVVPFQVQHFGIDAIGRLLMTDDLAMTLAVGSAASIPDPFLVSRALGHRKRTFPRADVFKLAAELNVSKIVIAHVGHDRKNSMHLTLQVSSRDGDSKYSWSDPKQREWANVSFTDEDIPSEVFHRILPDVIGVIADKSHPARLRKPGDVKTTLKRLDDPAEFLTKDVGDLLDLANRLSLIGTLAPRDPDEAAERAFIRTITLARQLQSDRNVRKLIARALFKLNRRPAALEIINGDKEPGAVALRALLNGNYNAAAHAAADVSSDVEQLMLDGLGSRKCQLEF